MMHLIDDRDQVHELRKEVAVMSVAPARNECKREGIPIPILQLQVCSGFQKFPISS